MKGQGNHERGNVLTIVLVGIIIFLATTNAAAVALALMNKEQYAPAAPASAPVAAEDTSDDARLLANQDREADAVLVADGAANYYSANNGFPSAYTNGSFTGPGTIKPVPVQLAVYRQVTVVSGAQKAIEGDNVRLVLKAACAANGPATVASATANAYVVQYSAQPKGGGVEAKCYTPRF